MLSSSSTCDGSSCLSGIVQQYVGSVIHLPTDLSRGELLSSCVDRVATCFLSVDFDIQSDSDC